MAIIKNKAKSKRDYVVLCKRLIQRNLAKKNIFTINKTLPKLIDDVLQLNNRMKGYIDSFYSSQNEIFYSSELFKVLKAKQIWNEVGITENDVNYDKLSNKKDVYFLPKIKKEDGNYNNFCSGFYNIETIPDFDFSKATNLSGAFDGCNSLKYIPEIDCSNLTSLTRVFQGCYSIEKIVLKNTDNITSISDFMYMTRDNLTLKEVDLGGVPNLESMYSSFRNCYNLESILNLNTTKIKNVGLTFWRCKKLKNIRFLKNSLNNLRTLQYYECYNLSYESMQSTIDALGVAKDTNCSIKLSKYLQEEVEAPFEVTKISKDHINALINNGWNIIFE